MAIYWAETVKLREKLHLKSMDGGNVTIDRSIAEGGRVGRQ